MIHNVSHQLPITFTGAAAKPSTPVTPAQAGVQKSLKNLDSRACSRTWIRGSRE